MNIELICKTLIKSIYFNKADNGLLENGLLSLAKERLNLENISIRYFPGSDNPHVMIHISPSNTNYRLTGNFKINENRIIFNIQRKDVETQLEYSSEYKIEDNNINHVYRTEGTPARIHNNSVNSTKFVKFSNPYYTINQLLTKIRKDNKPDLITIKSSLEHINKAKDYILKNYEDRMLIDLHLDKTEILKLNTIFKDQYSKKTYDNELRLAFEYYTRFMRRNLKVFYPEQLYEIPANKELYTTNNFYTNILANRYGNYYEDVRNVFTKSSIGIIIDNNNVKLEEYIDPLNLKFQKPFTATDIFLFYFGKRETAMDRYNLSTVENILALFNYIELLKSLMFSFVSLYIYLIKTMSKFKSSDLNINFKINQLYTNLSWTKSIESQMIGQININIKYNISAKGTIININLCEKKCKPLEYLDVIEIPYKNTILPIKIKKIPFNKYHSISYLKKELIYRTLDNNKNISIDIFKDSIEGAILLNKLDPLFISSLRKRFHETDDFSNKDETIYEQEYTELSIDEYLTQFPPLKETKEESESDIIISGYADENEDEDIEVEPLSLPEELSYASSLKPINFDELEEHVKAQSEFTRLHIEKLKFQIESNKLKKEIRPIIKQYEEIKLKLINLQKEIKVINKDLDEERYVDYDEEQNPEDIQLYYNELEEYRDELYEEFNEKKPIYDEISVKYNEFIFKNRRILTLFIPGIETKIISLIKANPNVIFKKLKSVTELESQEIKTRLFIETIEQIPENEDAQILKAQSILDELADEETINIGYGSSISRLKDKILDGLSEVSRGLIASKNKAMITETESSVQSTYNMKLLDEANRELILRQEEARKKIEVERQLQIKQFTQEDIRFKENLQLMELQFKEEREIEEQLEEIETQQIIALQSEKMKLFDEQKESIRLAELNLKMRELEEKEKQLKERLEQEKEKRKLSWEFKIRELEDYILTKEKELNKIPTLHKNRYTIYKLTILIRNANRLLVNEKALRKINERIYKLNLDYKIAKKARIDTEPLLLSANKQIRKTAFNAIKNEQLLQKHIEEIETKMEIIKKFIRSQRKRIIEMKNVGLIKTWPDVDEHLLKHKQELMELLKLTKEQIRL